MINRGLISSRRESFGQKDRPVVHIITGLGIGGAEMMLARLAPALAGGGLRQVVVSLSGEGPVARALTSSGVEVIQFDFKRVTTWPGSVVRLLWLIYRLRPRAIQGWLYHGDLAATLAHYLVPGRRDRRLVWAVRCSDMDLERHGRIIRLCARLSPLPDIVTANSETGAQHHLVMGYRPRRLEIVDNGFDTQRFQPDAHRRRAMRSSLNIAPQDLVIAHVARVDPMKDHATLLSAISGLEGIKVLFIGKGTKKLSIPSNAIALGARDDVPDLLTAADIVVSSSAFGEGFCNALAEGMAAGLVPVATNVGDARRILGDVGFIVPSRSPEALREVIEALRREARESSADFEDKKKAARNRILANYSLELAVARFADLYRA